MPTFIKAGLWEERTKPTQGYKKELNLENLIKTVSPPSNQSLNTTNNVAFLTVSSTSNGAGINYAVGDDGFIGDINISNTVQLKGAQTGTKGMIKFGSAAGAPVIGNRGGTTYLNIATTTGAAVVPVYADNAAALAGGLIVGDIYRTADVLKIVH